MKKVMLKKVMLIVAVAALLISSLAVAAYAYGPGGWGGRGGGWFKSLNLTADQQQKIQTIRQAFQKDTQTPRQDMRKKMQELRQLWTADNLNQGAIDAKTKEVNALRVQIAQKAREMFNKIKAILTPDQLKQLESQQQNREQNRQGRHRRGMWGGGFGCPESGQPAN